MAEENISEPENPNGEDSSGYGDLLGDFSNVFDENEEKTEEPQVNKDDLAISEILGEDISEDIPAVETIEPESIQEPEEATPEDMEISIDLDEITAGEEEATAVEEADAEADAVDFDLDDLGADAEEAAPEPEEATPEDTEISIDLDEITAGEDEAPVAEETAVEADAVDFGLDDLSADADETGEMAAASPVDSTAVTGELEAVAMDVVDVGDEAGDSDGGYGAADIDLDDDEPETVESAESAEMLIDEQPVEPDGGYASDDGADEGDEDSDFMELDLGMDDDESESLVSEDEPVSSEASSEEGEDDFLGLTGDGGDSGDTSAGTGGSSSAYAEVLLDGIEMDFDEQVSLVTRAEILLSQKKKDEALELFKQAAEKKGESHWVKKRIEGMS